MWVTVTDMPVPESEASRPLVWAGDAEPDVVRQAGEIFAEVLQKL